MTQSSSKIISCTPSLKKIPLRRIFTSMGQRILLLGWKYLKKDVLMLRRILNSDHPIQGNEEKSILIAIMMARIRVFTKICVYSDALDVISAVNGGPD
ncbi:hypothetical protein AAC387_Pa03g1004 [Persea americana]